MSPTSCVVSDISISNNLSMRGLGLHESHRIRHGHLPPTPRINQIDVIHTNNSRSHPCSRRRGGACRKATVS